MGTDAETTTRALKAFLTEEAHWELIPARVVGHPVVARRHETPGQAGAVRMPSQMKYVDHDHRSVAERTEAVMRACMAKAIEAAQAPAEKVAEVVA